MKWISISGFMAIVATVVVISACQPDARGGGGYKQLATDDYEIGEVASYPLYRKESVAYSQVLPFKPPFWPLISLVVGVVLMWSTRNFVDKYRYWTRAVILGFLFAPLPVPGGVHFPIGGLYPAGLGAAGGVVALFAGLVDSGYLVFALLSIPAMLVTVVSVLLFRVALSHFDDGNALSSFRYGVMFFVVIACNALVFLAGPVAYQKISQVTSNAVPAAGPQIIPPRESRGAVISALPSDPVLSGHRLQPAAFGDNSEQIRLRQPPPPKVIIVQPLEQKENVMSEPETSSEAEPWSEGDRE